MQTHVARKHETRLVRMEEFTDERLLEIVEQLDSKSQGFVLSLICDQDQSDDLILQVGSDIQYLSDKRRVAVCQLELYEQLKVVNIEEIDRLLAILNRQLDDFEKDILRKAIMWHGHQDFGIRYCEYAEKYGIALDVKWLKKQLSRLLNPQNAEWKTGAQSHRVQELFSIAQYILLIEGNATGKHDEPLHAFYRVVRRLRNIAFTDGLYFEYCMLRDRLHHKAFASEHQQSIQQKGLDDAVRLHEYMADIRLAWFDVKGAIEIMRENGGLTQPQLLRALDTMQRQGYPEHHWFTLINDERLRHDATSRLDVFLTIMEMMLRDERVASVNDKKVMNFSYGLHVVAQNDVLDTQSRKRLLQLRKIVIKKGFCDTAAMLSDFLNVPLTQKHLEILFRAVMLQDDKFWAIQNALVVVKQFPLSEKRRAIREMVALLVESFRPVITYNQKELLVQLRTLYEAEGVCDE